MKIELKSPFDKDYKAAYVNINKEPRRVCLLVRNDGTKTSISYAKYLMCCNLNRILTSEEEVDHIDNDKMNDVIENFQILSREENIRKSRKGRKMASAVCPICNIIFIKPFNQLSHRTNPTCSKKCGYIKAKSKR